MSKNNDSGGNTHYVSQSDASRIQSTQAHGGHNVGSDSFSSRAQSAGDRNANAGIGGSGGRSGSGGGGGQGGSGGGKSGGGGGKK